MFPVIAAPNDGDNDAVVLTLSHFPEIQPVVTKEAIDTKNASLDGRKQNNTCNAVVPVHKGTALTSSGIPSLATCNELLPVTYPWHIRTPEKESLKKVRTETSRRKENKDQNENRTKTKCAQSAGRAPTGQGCCLRVRSVL